MVTTAPVLKPQGHGRCICWFVVVVVMDEDGAGIVVLVRSEDEVVVLLVGAEPQPANMAMPAMSATPTTRRKRNVVSIIVCS